MAPEVSVSSSDSELEDFAPFLDELSSSENLDRSALRPLVLPADAVDAAAVSESDTGFALRFLPRVAAAPSAAATAEERESLVHAAALLALSSADQAAAAAIALRHGA